MNMLNTHIIELGGQAYELREPTGRDMIAISDASREANNAIELMAASVSQLLIAPRLSTEELLDGSYALMSGLADALEVFPVFADREGE